MTWFSVYQSCLDFSIRLFLLLIVTAGDDWNHPI